MIIKTSIVMPCLDEERFIGRAVESLLEGAGDDVEILVVDGGSRDQTRDLVRGFAERGAPVRLLDNPRRRVSAAMNIGIREARGDWIVRADAHCVYPPRYARRCVELLEKTGAANAGGVQVPVVEALEARAGGGSGRGFQAAVALALRHPLGVGNARWRLGRRSGFVDTVYLGAFRRDLFEEIGGFDEEADSNQDAELNMRIRAAGKTVYLDHTLEVLYYPRESLRGLARQFFRYGRGRARTALKHRRLTSWRQAAAPLLLVGLGGSLVAAVLNPMFLLVPAAYAAGLAVFALLSRFPGLKCGGREESPGPFAGTGRVPASTRSAANAQGQAGARAGLGCRLRVALVWAVMHISWGAGFLSDPFLRRKSAVIGNVDSGSMR
ncbi:MAG: glycosyltransferase family 2 protein [Acidobacteriota bacterium]|nr:glycosyltransferase family 2 protein [Acidobacteriota bacterium]